MAAVLLYVCSAFVVWMCYCTTQTLADNLNCPSSCSCLKSHATCVGTGLVNIPKDIPPWITHLDLRYNGISEILPDDFKGLDNIVQLDIGKNNLKYVNGSVFRDLTSLRKLKLDRNKLHEIPIFPEFSGITELSLSHNKIAAINIQAFENMPNLTSLDISSNRLISVTNGTFPAGCKLTDLNLDSNAIVVLEKGGLANLTELETLKINQNNLKEIPINGFVSQTKLKILELMKNQISEIRQLTFQGLENLHTLKLKRNIISVLDTAAFFNLNNLVNLQIGHNKITSITQDWVFGMTNLKTLSMPRNWIKDIDPEGWSCKQLVKLDLSRNRLTAIKRNTWDSVKQLRQLVLHHNRISRIDEGAFMHLKRLNTLDLSYNHLSTSMEDPTGVFQNLGRLKHLDLQSNGITSIAVHAFSGLKQLQELNLAQNEITTIQENPFETLRDLQTLTFNSSMMSCDCHLAWLPSWLQAHGYHYTALGSCHHPAVLRGMSVFKADMNEDCSVNGQFLKPVILESPRATKGFKGKNVSVSCVAGITGNSQPRIQWRKDNAPIRSSLSEVKATRKAGATVYNSTLHLQNLQDTSSGMYHCVVSNTFGHAHSEKAYINVYVYPEFTERPMNVTVKVGKNAELKCSASGQPQPEISWQKDGGVNFPAARERRMKVMTADPFFFIMRAKPEDEGVYTCTAKSEAGTITSNATLTVMETPGFVQPMQRVMQTRRGENSVLQCMASGSPRPRLVWLKDGLEFPKTRRHFYTVDKQILVIVGTLYSDAGVYSCRISNSLGTVKGVTELRVLTESGEPVDDNSNSFGLDDKSTTTGIIIIAVVCCVVGTSLVWVIIIYQTRKRHEMYSAAPSDETTLPGEVPSSGYMSSDREGSYSQGPLTVAGYHHQDYTMKESGYESSSGQFRVRAPYASGVDEDEPEPVMTAGDRLLRKMAEANPSRGLQYMPCRSDDGDTLGSGHSSSDGYSPSPGQSVSPAPHHSSGLDRSQQPLQVNTGSMEYHQHFYPPELSVQPSPGSDYYTQEKNEPMTPSHDYKRKQVGESMPALGSERRPLLQTFHPKKHTSASQERFHANTLDGVSGRGAGGEGSRKMFPHRRALSRDAVTITDRGDGDDDSDRWYSDAVGFRPRTNSDSCDRRPGQQSQFVPVAVDPCQESIDQCTECGCKVRSSGEKFIDKKPRNSSGNKQGKSGLRQMPMSERFGEYAAPCCSNHITPGAGDNKNSANTTSGPAVSYISSSSSSSSSGSNNCDVRPFASSSSPLIPLSSSSSSEQSQHHHQPHHHQYHHNHHKQQQPAYDTSGHHKNGHGKPQHLRGCVNNKSYSNSHKTQSSADSGCDSLCDHEHYPPPHRGSGMGPPCCCEVMRDSRFCTTCSHSESGMVDGQVMRQQHCQPWCRHNSRHYQNGSKARQGNESAEDDTDYQSCNCENKSYLKAQNHRYDHSKQHSDQQPSPQHRIHPSAPPPPYTPPVTPPPYIPPPDRPPTTTATYSSPPPSSSSSSHPSSTLASTSPTFSLPPSSIPVSPPARGGKSKRNNSSSRNMPSKNVAASQALTSSVQSREINI